MIQEACGIEGNLIDENRQLLLFRAVIGECCHKPVGSFIWNFGFSPGKCRRDGLCEPIVLEVEGLRQ